MSPQSGAFRLPDCFASNLPVAVSVRSILQQVTQFGTVRPGEARTNRPFAILSMLPWTIGTPNNGSAIVMAGGIGLIAAVTDNLIRSIDMKSGKSCVRMSFLLPLREIFGCFGGLRR